MKIIVLIILLSLILFILWKITKLFFRLIVFATLLLIISLFVFEEDKSILYHPIIGQSLISIKDQMRSCQAEKIRFISINKSVELQMQANCENQVVKISQVELTQGKIFLRKDNMPIQESDLIRKPFYYPLLTFYYFNLFQPEKKIKEYWKKITLLR